MKECLCSLFPLEEDFPEFLELEFLRLAVDLALLVSGHNFTK